MIAAREPLAPADALARAVAGDARSPPTVDGVAVHAAHVPNAANGWVKPDTLAAMRAGLEAGTGPRILCGDLNTPRREHPDGTVISFARDTRERLREERGERWDGAELGVVPGLRDLGFADAFRALHGYERKEPSWVFSHGGGWRLDHVFVSAELEPVAADLPPRLARRRPQRPLGARGGRQPRPRPARRAEALARLLAGHRPLAPADLLGVVDQRAEEVGEPRRADARPGRAAPCARQSSNTTSMSKYGM